MLLAALLLKAEAVHAARRVRLVVFSVGVPYMCYRLIGRYREELDYLWRFQLRLESEDLLKPHMLGLSP